LLNTTTSMRLQNIQAHKQETSNAQAHKQETYNQTDLHRKLFEFEHLIYNQWCSQYKSITDSYDSWDYRISKIWTLLRNSKWLWNANNNRVWTLNCCKSLTFVCVCIA